MGNPGGWPLAACPTERRRWPVTATRRDAGCECRARRDPTVTQRDPVPPRGRVPRGRLRRAAPHRAVLGPQRRRPTSPDAGAYSESRRPRGRSPSRATECPRPSPRHLPRTQLRGATAATRASPQPLSLHVTSGLSPAPARQSQWTFGPADRGSRWESESSACARSDRHNDDCCWHPASLLIRCHLRLFSGHIPFFQALFLYPMELLPQSSLERTEITGWVPTQRPGPSPGHSPSP